MWPVVSYIEPPPYHRVLALLENAPEVRTDQGGPAVPATVLEEREGGEVGGWEERGSKGRRMRGGEKVMRVRGGELAV